MEQADQTLHDFVLNLLSDTQSLAAFEQDPAAMLDHAGLGDISAADVQEVMPLVLDLVPNNADVLESALANLPLDSVDTGQLGAIQQLQFVTAALGVPFHAEGSFGGAEFQGAYAVDVDAAGDVHAAGGVHSALGSVDGYLAASPDAGLEAGIAASSPFGSLVNTHVNLPGLSALGALPGIGAVTGALGDGFGSNGDLATTLDSHVSEVTAQLTNSANTTANLLAGATDLTAGTLANPAALEAALTNPQYAVTALAGTAEAYAAYGATALPAPANAVAAQAVQAVSAATAGPLAQVTGEVSQVSSEVTSTVTSHLPVPMGADPAQALGGLQSAVTGVVGQLTEGVTSHLPVSTGALGDLSHVDPTGITSTVTSVVGSVASVASSSTDLASHSVSGDAVSHSAVTDLVSGGGVASGAAGITSTVDHAVSDLGHVTDLLHLPL